MKDFDKIFGKVSDYPQTKIFYAYDMIVSGLRSYCGDSASWLDGYDMIVEWLKDNKGKGLLVIGDAGLGKSILCRDIIPTVLNHCKMDNSCGVVTAYDLARTGETGFYREFLSIDDIGVEEDYASFGVRRNMVREVVDRMESFRKVLIMTTNLSVEDIRKKYGERTWDRLVAMMKIVILQGKSMRCKENCGNPIPNIPRAYGVNFETQEEAEAFREQQDEYYEGLESGKYERAPKDYAEVNERQPLKLWHGKLCALMKYDWDKLGE